jgi:threonine/homoserine/homoserine lactone efflux protein
VNPDLLLPFALATLTFAVMPGPALLYAAAQTLARGRRGGMMAALGIHLGGWVHVIAAAAGLSALFAAAPAAFWALKFLGAAYLVWMGLGMLLRRAAPPDPAAAARSERRAFRDSVLVEVLNPKTALFFVAFLPQFADPAAAWPVWAQLLALGTAVNLTFTAADLAVVYAAGSALRAAQGRGVALARRIGGATLVGLGVKLATDRP